MNRGISRMAWGGNGSRLGEFERGGGELPRKEGRIDRVTGDLGRKMSEEGLIVAGDQRHIARETKAGFQEVGQDREDVNGACDEDAGGPRSGAQGRIQLREEVVRASVMMKHSEKRRLFSGEGFAEVPPRSRPRRRWHPRAGRAKHAGGLFSGEFHRHGGRRRGNRDPPKAGGCFRHTTPRRDREARCGGTSAASVSREPKVIQAAAAVREVSSRSARSGFREKQAGLMISSNWKPARARLVRSSSTMTTADGGIARSGREAIAAMRRGIRRFLRGRSFRIRQRWRGERSISPSRESSSSAARRVAGSPGI